jgi:predicted DNA repair protein MutK
LALLDDIATLLDDVAAQSKIATTKTAGVLGDDLALNAQQVTGVRAEREIPVVLAVAKGSLLNKAALIPIAMLISAFAPWAITPLLMVGGAYLCFEGVEKVLHRFLNPEVDQERAERVKAIAEPKVDMVEFERKKIRGAVITDLVLSGEILVLALATVASEPLLEQFLTLVVVSLIITFAVYGFVAGIVRMDDVGLRLVTSTRTIGKALGRFLLWFAPVLMRVLAVVGTIAMWLVGGGIYTHGLPFLHHMSETVIGTVSSVAVAGPALAVAASPLFDGVVGVVVGSVLVGLFMLGKLVLGRSSH